MMRFPWFGFLLGFLFWLVILLSVRLAFADNFYCIQEDMCVSTTRYGDGSIYRVKSSFGMAWVKIDCKNATLDVSADGEPWTGPSPIDFGNGDSTSIAAALYHVSCRTRPVL